ILLSQHCDKSFTFSSHGYYLDLNSFPTRRSSDLALSDEKFNKKMLLMPVEYRIDNKDKNIKMRRIADYIGGMMDPSAIEMYSKIYGDNEIKKYYDKSLYRYR